MSLRLLIVLCLIAPVICSCAQTQPPLRHIELSNVSFAATTQPSRLAKATTDDLVAILLSDTTSPYAKDEACEALRLMGPSASGAIDALVEALQEGDLVRLHAAEALAAIGPAAKPAMRAALADRRSIVREAVIWAQIAAHRDVALLANQFHHESTVRVADIALHGNSLDQIDALSELESRGTDAAEMASLIRPLLESPSPQVAEAAANALGAMGATPLLIEGLKSPRQSARIVSAAALCNLTGGMFRDASPEGIDALAHALDDPSPAVVKSAARGICNSGVRMHPALLKAIKGGNEIVKAEVLAQLLTRPQGFTQDYPNWPETLDQFEPTEIELGKLFAPILLEQAKAGNDTVRIACVEALRCLPPTAVSGELIEVVKLRLGDSDSQFPTEVAAAILAELGQAGVPKLKEAMNGNDAVLRAAAMNALARMTDMTRDAKFIELMTAATTVGNDSDRTAAFRWLLALPDPPPVVIHKVADFLVRAYEWRDLNGITAYVETDRLNAIKLLGRYPLETPVSVKALTLALSDNYMLARSAAVVALRSYKDNVAPAVPRLKELLESNFDDPAKVAATMLVCGREGRLAVAPYYLNRLKDPQLNDLSETLKAIAVIGPDATPAIPQLQSWLNGRDNTRRVEVADALGEIGPAATSAVPALLRMMDNPDFDIRQSASIALVKIVPDGKGLAPALMAAVYNDDGAAAERLAGVIPSGDAGKLIKRLDQVAADDPDAHVRATADHVLHAMMQSATKDSQ